MKNIFLSIVIVMLVSVSVSSCGGDEQSVMSESDPPANSNLTEICPIFQIAKLTIDTRNSQPVVDKKNYVPAEISIYSETGILIKNSANIRGRGNSTWTMPKKPYLIKFDGEQEILGMHPNKKWVLLANYADKSILRNALAFCIARMLNLPYTPDDRFVELVMNGEYMGIYQLTNKTHQIDDLIQNEVSSYFETVAENSTFDDPFFLEIDARLDGDYWFYSESGIPYVFVSDSNEDQLRRVRVWINKLESDIEGEKYNELIDKIGAQIDFKSMIDVYLINELAKNTDAYRMSAYLFRRQGGKMSYGPVWDYDLAFGNVRPSSVQNPEGWHARNVQGNWYFRELLKSPDFFDLVKKRWKRINEQVPNLQKFVERTASSLDDAQTRNFNRWPIFENQQWGKPTVDGIYENEVAYLREWIDLRAKWIDDNIDKLN